MAVKLADTKAANEVKALDSFYIMLQNEPNRAFYGYKLPANDIINFILRFKDVERANESNAIEMLLITDELFRYGNDYHSNCIDYTCRSSDVALRQRYVALVDSVKDTGGTVR